MWSMIMFLFPLHTQRNSNGLDISATEWGCLAAMHRRLPVVQSVMQCTNLKPDVGLVILSYLFDLNEDNVKKASESLGDETAYAIANVTDEDSVVECIKSTVDKFGGIHIVVNCAGIGSASKTVGKDGAHPLQYFKTVV